jgi:hypothetical protein
MTIQSKFNTKQVGPSHQGKLDRLKLIGTKKSQTFIIKVIE